MIMKKLILSLMLIFSSSAYAIDIYEIEVAYNDEFFIINDEKFEAKSYCLGWEEGDQVIFLDGDPNGICVSAVLYSKTRHEVCEVWCE